ncbi:unnamed protein product [Cyprideis torosa]|uniref:Uncharacterized protein n=1 Tax=Cyprideis torosa TaxID=163714 RepID=A0A7R8WQB3_9CRUS|nr:unnamed protein product [Cyprideis torosa]CAG0907853.1 unnamed protein product [Cyprideis torosa]
MASRSLRSLSLLRPVISSGRLHFTMRVPVAITRHLSVSAARLTNTSVAKVDKELVEFLHDEIAQENKTRKTSFPTTIGGFNVVLKGAEVELKKEADGENIAIKFNVNHSLNPSSKPAAPGASSDAPPVQEKDSEDMLSSPSFDIEVTRSGRTLSFSCSFAPEEEVEGTEQDGYADLFTIDEVTMFESDWKETDYAVSGEILDGYLYDLLMNFLEARGITSEFMGEVQEFATSYEQNMYVGLLEGLKNFCTK